MDTLIVNLFGSPGAGKSTGAAYIFSLLKMNGVNAELVTEFAKDKLWEETKAVFANQAYIFGKQSFRLSRCANKVDVIVTDSPLLLSIIYNKALELTDSFNKYVFDVFNSFENINYYLQRAKKYNPIGRFQTENESDQLGCEIKEMLDEYSVDYKCMKGNKEGYEEIVEEILTKLAEKKMQKNNLTEA